jgi:hypothetical protein
LVRAHSTWLLLCSASYLPLVLNTDQYSIYNLLASERQNWKDKVLLSHRTGQDIKSISTPISRHIFITERPFQKPVWRKHKHTNAKRRIYHKWDMQGRPVGFAWCWRIGVETRREDCNRSVDVECNMSEVWQFSYDFSLFLSRSNVTDKNLKLIKYWLLYI